MVIGLQSSPYPSVQIPWHYSRQVTDLEGTNKTQRNRCNETLQDDAAPSGTQDQDAISKYVITVLFCSHPGPIVWKYRVALWPIHSDSKSIALKFSDLLQGLPFTLATTHYTVYTLGPYALKYTVLLVRYCLLSFI